MDSIQDEIIEEFSVFDDWLDKYDYLIGLSETLPAIAPEHRTERYLIEVVSFYYLNRKKVRLHFLEDNLC